jgi:excisionase family DNA binding protein
MTIAIEPCEKLAYTVREAAEMLRVSPSTIRSKIYAGVIPTLDKEVVGDRLLIPRIWMDKLIEDACKLPVYAGKDI